VIVAITGASAGIGRACAERIARDGHAVVLNARRAELLQDVVTAITSAGGRALAVPGDVTNPGDMRTLVARAVDAFARLDAMICNAGIGFHGTLGQSTPEVSKRLVDVNVLGTLYAAHAAHEVFTRQGNGHLIAISSVAGLRGVSGMSVYSATKAAQMGFIESLRTEFLGSGLHASIVYPVSTRTEFHAAMHTTFGHAVEGKGPKQDAEAVAEAVLRCLAHPRGEVFPYGPVRWLRLANAISPTLVDRFMRRFSRRRPYDPGSDGIGRNDRR
jgi:NADP-dependent 3-hydroxy acid dehydrogenase YdfG